MDVQVCCARSKRVLRTVTNLTPESRELRQLLALTLERGNYSLRMKDGPADVWLGRSEVETLLYRSR